MWFVVIVGLVVLLQQTPRAVTIAPPSVLMVPPLAAVVLVMAVTTVVVRVGMVEVDAVVKVESPP